MTSGDQSTRPAEVKTPEFDERHLKEIVEKYAFPRLVMSAGEARARAMVKEDYRARGLEPIEEPFDFSTFFANFCVRGTLGMLGILFVLFVVRSFLPAWHPVFVGYFAVLAVYLVFWAWAFRHPTRIKPQNRHSTNIYAKIPCASQPAAPRGVITISAHYDTKSQRISVWARCIVSLVVYVLSILNGGLIVATLLVEHAGLPVSPTYLWALRALLLVDAACLWVLALNKIENKSVGAVDNAAGMAIVFALTEWLQAHPLQHHEVWSIQFGAEELGTMGSRVFLERHARELRDRGTFAFNFDMIDDRVQYLRARGIIPQAQCKHLAVAFETAARELDIPFSKYNLLTGASSDQKSFQRHKIEAIDFQDRSGAKYAHSTRDTPDKVQPHLLRQSCEIAAHMILQVDRGELRDQPMKRTR